MSQINSILAKFLREKRTQAELTQTQVARVLGYSTPQFISNWERGLSSPPIMTLKRLSDLYKVDEDEMFNVVLEATIEQVEESLRRQFYSSRKSRKA